MSFSSLSPQGPLFDMPGVHVDGMDVLKVWLNKLHNP